jgi:lysine 2,3-aminomutase
MPSENTAVWKKIVQRSITTAEEAISTFKCNAKSEIERVIRRYPMRINPYFLNLIEKKDDPIYRQCFPDIREITDTRGLEDPLNEEALSPVPGLTHRYPDRVLFLVSSQCAVYCRFCNRKRKVGLPAIVTRETVEEGIRYIRHHQEVRDVLLSGGDPLLLENRALRDILSQLRAIAHVQIIRIGTRVPCTLPQRITPQLAAILKCFHPLYVNTQFNHPREITPHSALACARLADAGISMGCQTVLLRGINDDPEIMTDLMHQLLRIRVRPYYLFQPDLAQGTAHFWTPLDKGLEIMRRLQGHTSGLCTPHFAIDLPGGGGKVPILPKQLISREKDCWLIRNYRGEIFRYPFIKGLD